MKVFIISILVMTSFSAFAKRDVDMGSFNKALMENIDTTLKHNPQTYEKNEDITRKPASVTPVEVEKKMEDRSHKMEDIEVQSPGNSQW
jgi:hypothetical protein